MIITQYNFFYIIKQSSYQHCNISWGWILVNIYTYTPPPKKKGVSAYTSLDFAKNKHTLNK